MPDQPVVAAKAPAVLELEPGTYWWCRCGRSKTQPWCDGSHKGTGLEPMELKQDVKKKVAMCQCKHSNHKPFCDGSHRQVP